MNGRRGMTVLEMMIAFTIFTLLIILVVNFMTSTNVEIGKRILADSGLNVVAANDMADGAKKIVELAK